MNIRTPEAFAAWLPVAPAGEPFCYHYGHLAEDRVYYDDTPVEPIDALARAAWDASEAGLVVLVQERWYGHYRYIALRTEELVG